MTALKRKTFVVFLLRKLSRYNWKGF